MTILPRSCDVTGGIPNRSLKAYGNFIYGDCTVAAYYHIEMFKNIARGSSFKKLLWRLGFHTPTNQNAVDEYAAYLKQRLNVALSPNSPGVAVDDFLNWQKARGNVVAWAQLTPDQNGATSDASLCNALFTFRGVLLAGNLTLNSYFNFPSALWDIGPSPKDMPDPSLAHAIALDRYTPTFDECVTWGSRQKMTTRYRRTCFNGAFVFLLASEKDDIGFAERLAFLQTIPNAIF